MATSERDTHILPGHLWYLWNIEGGLKNSTGSHMWHGSSLGESMVTFANGLIIWVKRDISNSSYVGHLKREMRMGSGNHGCYKAEKMPR